jgi:hypothetical protein
MIHRRSERDGPLCARADLGERQFGQAGWQRRPSPPEREWCGVLLVTLLHADSLLITLDVRNGAGRQAPPATGMSSAHSAIISFHGHKPHKLPVLLSSEDRLQMFRPLI